VSALVKLVLREPHGNEACLVAESPGVEYCADLTHDVTVLQTLDPVDDLVRPDLELICQHIEGSLNQRTLRLEEIEEFSVNYVHRGSRFGCCHFAP
jgi:hypothetical protein